MTTTAFPPEALKAIAEEVASLLKARQETISVAETAAGGLISAALLAMPGASGFYKGGVTVCILYYLILSFLFRFGLFLEV